MQKSLKEQTEDLGRALSRASQALRLLTTAKDHGKVVVDDVFKDEWVELIESLDNAREIFFVGDAT